MQKSQPTKTVRGKGSSILGASSLPLGADIMPLGESKSFAKTTTATTPKGLPLIDKKTVLKAKLDLVAGALADFQAAGGRIACKNVDTITPSGSVIVGVKIYLVADFGIMKSQTADGLEFDLVAEKG